MDELLKISLGHDPGDDRVLCSFYSIVFAHIKCEAEYLARATKFYSIAAEFLILISLEDFLETK